MQCACQKVKSLLKLVVFILESKYQTTTCIQSSPALSRGYATLRLSNAASVMRNRFDFTRQKLLGCREEMLVQHAPFFRPTNKIKSVPLCFTQLVYRKANSCFCVALFLWIQYIGQRRVFKIQVLSWQTASENGLPYDPVCTDYLQHCKVITLPNKLCKEKSVISAAESSLSPPMETSTQLSLFTARVAGISA